VFTFLQFVYGFYCNFTGQTIIDDWFITLFNLLFTSLPLGARALLDHDVKREDGDIIYLMLPFLYAENRFNPFFTMMKFFLTLLKGIVHSVINFFWVIYMLDESVDEDGKIGGLWFCSVNLFTNILIIVSVDLLLETKYHTWINFVIILVITFVAYIIFIVIVHNMSMFNSVGTMYVAFNSARMWFNIIFVGGTCCLIDYFLLCLEFIFFPSLVNKLQVLVNQKIDMSINNINKMPKIIKEIMENYCEVSSDDNFNQAETKKVNLDNNEINIINEENIYIEGDKDAELIKIKNNVTKAKESGGSKKIEGSTKTNENENININTLNEDKLKNKTDVLTLKDQKENNQIIEEDANSKEAFLK
jgi:magnesium-transporting ATPase (P-type)